MSIYECWKHRVEFLEDERTRLKTQLDQAHQAMKTWEEGALKDKAEIDRLKSQLSVAKEALEDIGSHCCHPDCNHQEVAKEALKKLRETGE